MSTALAALNSVLAGVLFIFAIKYIRSGRNRVARGLKAAYAVIGLYWCALYAFVAIAPVEIADPVWFGRVFVRPAFTLTLAIMASGALYRWRSNDGPS